MGLLQKIKHNFNVGRKDVMRLRVLYDWARVGSPNYRDVQLSPGFAFIGTIYNIVKFGKEIRWIPYTPGLDICLPTEREIKEYREKAAKIVRQSKERGLFTKLGFWFQEYSIMPDDYQRVLDLAT
ncbi:MAG: hypothetical protein NTX24_05525 [Candidatus Pacearchaeota archaeon]|nr:hypothetical protein [Candidatus Pacearchaeota archaeon]